MKRALLYPLVLMAFAPAAWAWPPTFGAEFTFSDLQLSQNPSERIVNTVEAIAAQQRMRDKILENCKACTMREVGTANKKVYRFEYPDGTWFQVNTDPGVIEVQTSPMTLEQIEKLHARMEQDIFTNARRAGLNPFRSMGLGGGHIHIGFASAFENDPVLFRNFVADFANHSELGLGILAKDFRNSPPLVALAETQQQTFTKVLDDFDSGLITDSQTFARKLQERVYYKTVETVGPAEKYQALNVVRAADPSFGAEATVELRSIRPEGDAQEFYKLVSLFQRRLELLKTLGDKRLPFEPQLHDRTPEGMVGAFRQYVEESGLSWDDYREQIPEEWQEIAPKKPAIGVVQLAKDPSPQKLSIIKRTGLCLKNFFGYFW